MRHILYILLLCFSAGYASAQCTPIITPQGSTTFCDGDDVILSGSPGDTYQWYLNGNAITGANSDTYIATTAGDYTVEIDSVGCIATSAIVTVTVNTVPAQPGPITGPTIACNGQLLTYSVASVQNATSYTWLNNGSPVPGTTNSVQITGGVIQYHITVTANNSCGSSLASPTLTADGTATPNNTGLVYIPGASPICPGEVEHISLLVVHSGDIFTFYKNGSVVQSGPSQGYGATTSGSYYCVVTNSGGCSAQTNSHNIVFAAGPATPVIIQAGPSITTTQVYSSWVWYLNGSPVGTGQYYHTTQDGDYKVVVGNSAPCFSESAIFLVDYTDVKTQNISEEVAIYPNPNTGAFTLSANIPLDERTVTIVVTDITGKHIMSKEVRSQKGTIEEQMDLENAAPGMYFLKLSSGSLNKTVSFVKQ